MGISRVPPNPALSRTPDFSAAWSIYKSSFPADERRNFRDQLGILRHPEYFFRPVRDNTGAITAVIAGWSLTGFTFVEHLAVSKKFRGLGIGSQVMGDFIRDKDLVIIECEPPEMGPEALARVRFYQRLGFELNAYEYLQPAYGAGKKPVELRILSYPAAIGREEFLQVQGDLYKTVYKVTEAAAVSSKD